jgi:hypothetical protein
MGLGARWCRAYSKLLLLVVETCKVDQSPVSIAEDSGCMV